jgi:indole-3-glycerol phosphate synthase
MTTILSTIVASHRAAAAADRRDPDELEARALATPGPGSLTGALTARPGELAVIAELKRRSPSKGDLALDLDPAEAASAYAGGGAACLSVLTDRDFFGGSPDDLAAAKKASGLPVLRKDFTVSANDVCDARLMGADAVLLIVAALDEHELESFLSLAGRLHLDALVEVHDEAELVRALDTGTRLVGVNQRDLRTFAVDPERAERLARRIPDGVVAVAESGIGGREDARRLAEAGYQAVLVGETLVRAPDRSAAVAEMVGLPVADRPVLAGPT